VLAAGVLGGAAAAPGQEPLTCGVPLLRTLPPGGVHVYRVDVSSGAAGSIQTSAVSPLLGLRRMRLVGPGGVIADTPTGIIEFRDAAGPLTLEVSQNSGGSGGDYAVALNVIAEDGGHCGRPLDCGATPAGIGFAVPGAVDSYQIPLDPSDRDVTLKINYLEPARSGEAGAPYMRLFDPDGNEVMPGQCTATYAIKPQVAGIYTALVSACGAPQRRTYRMELYKDGCPRGPTITHFGITNAQGDPVPVTGFDDAGRPIFALQLGSGLHVVAEARAGRSGRRAGEHTTSYEERGTAQDADLQIILSDALGDGDPTICDVVPPDLGGVPATVPLEFDDAPVTLDHIEDMGCRFDNGRGEHLGRRDSIEACTRTNQGFGESFVDRASSIQYCTGVVATDWAFRVGRTVVKGRVKDTFGSFGAPREIVVRIGGIATRTPTPTPTATPPPPTSTGTRTVTATARITRTTPPTINTPTATRTRTGTTPTPTTGTPIDMTPTPTPSGPCTGDCDGSGAVAINEVVLAANIALGNTTLAVCPAADPGGDGSIDIGDLVQCVSSSLRGCSR